MKLTKTRINEAEEVASDVAINLDGGLENTAKELAKGIEASTGGNETVSTEAAIAAAAKVSNAADEISAETVLVSSGDEPLGVQNFITETLDKAYRAVKRNRRRGQKVNANVLIVGLPGSGKTATVYDWIKQKQDQKEDVQIVTLNAKNNDLDAYINGYTTKDIDEKTGKAIVRQIFSDNLKALDERPSILFLDELNRQIKPQIRASLLTVINEHAISGDDEHHQHILKNLLFTIACINPAVKTDKGAAPLDDAELSRFFYHVKDYDSSVDAALDYLKKETTHSIKKLNKDDEYYLEDLEDALRCEDLGTFILSHSHFGFDGLDKLEDLFALQRKMLNQRAFTEMLINTQGNVAEVKHWLNTESGLLDETRDKLLSIIDEYIEPTFEQLCEARGITLDKPIELKDETNKDIEAEPTSVDAEQEIEDIEDDDILFGGTQTTTSNTVKVKTPADAKQSINKAMLNW